MPGRTPRTPIPEQPVREARIGRPTVLNERLREPRESHLVEFAEPEGYGLTPSGHEIGRALEPLVAWPARWARAAASNVAP